MEYAVVFNRLEVRASKHYPYKVKEEKDLIAGEVIVIKDSSLLLAIQVAKLMNEAFNQGVDLGNELKLFNCSLIK